MRNFLATVLVLVFFETIALSYMPKSLTAHEDVVFERGSDMASRESFDSSAVESNGIRLEISEPDLIVLPIPENRHGVYSSVKLHILITNNTPMPFRISRYATFIPDLVAPNGQVLQRQVATSEEEGEIQLNEPSELGWSFRFARFISNIIHQFGQRETRDTNYLLVELGWPKVIFITARLYWQNNQLQLQFTTTYFRASRVNKFWLFDNLNSGTYQFRLIYDGSSETRPSSTPETIEIRTSQEIGSGQLVTPFVNLRLVQPVDLDRSAVAVDGICFEILMPERVLTVPEKKFGVETHVQLGIRIINNTPTPFRFSSYGKLIPEIVKVDGQALQRGRRRSGTLKPLESHFPLAMPGESVTFFPDAKLFWRKRDQFTLSIATGTGGYWSFEALNLGIYQVRFTYNNKNAVATIREGRRTDTKLLERLWIGRVLIPFLEFRLV